MCRFFDELRRNEDIPDDFVPDKTKSLVCALDQLAGKSLRCRRQQELIRLSRPFEVERIVQIHWRLLVRQGNLPNSLSLLADLRKSRRQFSPDLNRHAQR